MKNIYLAQPNFLFGADTAYLPYSAGVLAAAAFSHELIAKYYLLKDIFFVREDINTVLDRIENPFIIGFSCYVWNYEYNKFLATKIKEKFPDCIILFGGHQIEENSIDILLENDYIDILSYGESEETFTNLLIELISSYDLSKISNIAFRDSYGKIKITKISTSNNKYISASPYLSGIFDKLIVRYPQFVFNATLETNRGCPFSCAYCDWGRVLPGMEGSPVRLRDMEIIKDEIIWMAKNKIQFVMGADANFGIFERDDEIVDHLINANKQYGFPKTFRVAYTKQSTEKVFETNRKMNKYKMSKGATLSFQSLNTKALKNIGRKNIQVTDFFKLMKLYNAQNIPTYTEMIIGLPGETYESWCEGLNILLDNGQHTSINIYNCEVLKNSTMATEEYKKKFKIETTKTPLYQYHILEQENDILEYSEILTKTYSMSANDWCEFNVFSWAVQCYHCLGLLQFIAIYLRYENHVLYSLFYNLFIDFCKKNSRSIAGQLLKKVEKIFNSALTGHPIIYMCDNTENIIWPVEEGSFIDIVSQIDLFYTEIKSFIASFDIDDAKFYELLKYQKNIIRVADKSDFEMHFDYAWHTFFKNIYNNEYKPLEKRSNCLYVKTNGSFNNIKDYAINIVWYGRKGGRNLYTDIEMSLL